MSVAVNGDRYDESNETFSLVVTPKPIIANGTDDNVGIATIINDDPADEVIVIGCGGGLLSEPMARLGA